MRTDDLQWVMARGQTPDYAFLLRFCEMPANFPRERFPLRLNVFWTVAQPSPEGMPSSSDSDLMQAFEERVVAATEPEGVAVLPMVLTGRGQREYVFYVRSADDFLQCLANMPQESEPYPIEIHSHDDPGWGYYDDEVASVRPDAST